MSKFDQISDNDSEIISIIYEICDKENLTDEKIDFYIKGYYMGQSVAYKQFLMELG